jgi:hypothetical protein
MVNFFIAGLVLLFVFCFCFIEGFGELKREKKWLETNQRRENVDTE